MQPPRHLDPSLLKQAQPLKPYLDNYLSHNTPEMQKDAAALGPFSNFPLSMSIIISMFFENHLNKFSNIVLKIHLDADICLWHVI